MIRKISCLKAVGATYTVLREFKSKNFITHMFLLYIRDTDRSIVSVFLVRIIIT